MKLVVPYNYTPRPYQIPLLRALDSGVKRAISIWHRRAGKDKTLINLCAKKMLERVGSYYYFFPTYAQGKKVIWDGMDKTGFPFLNHFPKELLAGVPNSTEMKLRFKNGSVFQVVGSDNIDSIMGTNPVGCVYSEFSLQDPTGADYMSPILMENGGWEVYNTTPRGKNHAYRLYMMAKDNPEWFSEILTVNDTGVITPEMIQAERERGRSEEFIQQEYFCFPPDAPITTHDGLVPIHEIREGDLVLTHSGRWRTVRATICRDYIGEMVTIKTFGNGEDLVCTPNHQVRVLDPATQEYQWVPAGDIEKGMFLTMPRIKPGMPVISTELAKLIGWYIAEGSVSKNHIQFSLSRDEQEFADEIISCAKSIGFPAVWSDVETGKVVCLNSTTFADFLVAHCGSGAVNKKIPMTLISGHEKTVYDTLMLGDGCFADKGEFHSYTTVSKTLAYQFQLLANSLGLRAGIYCRKTAGQAVICGRTVNVLDSYAVQVRFNGEGIKIKPAKHSIGVMVRSVDRDKYSGKVHNFSVEKDESYVAYGRVVHNCSFNAPMDGAVYGEQMRKAQSDGRICSVPHDPALPVETWWDIGHNNVIWFTQTSVSEIRMIDYEHHVGKDVPFWVKLLKDKKYTYDTHHGPWDIEQAVVGITKTWRQMFADLGIEFRRCERTPVQTGLEASRMILGRCVFDNDKCVEGIDSLQSYRYLWDAKKEDFTKEPYHDGASHGADAFRLMAINHTDVLPGSWKNKGKIKYPSLGIV